MTDDVGPRLKKMRRMHGMSQRELARRAGMTHGTISLIENGQSSPQVASLRKILTAFDVSITDFFLMDINNDEQVIYRADELVDIGDESIRLFLIGAKRKDRALQLVHETYAVGASTGDELLSHEGEEAGIVISGRLEVTVGGNISVLSRGDAYYFSSQLPHRFRNSGRTECVVISAATPPSF